MLVVLCVMCHRSHVTFYLSLALPIFYAFVYVEASRRIINGGQFQYWDFKITFPGNISTPHFSFSLIIGIKQTGLMVKMLTIVPSPLY